MIWPWLALAIAVVVISSLWLAKGRDRTSQNSNQSQPDNSNSQISNGNANSAPDWPALVAEAKKEQIDLEVSGFIFRIPKSLKMDRSGEAIFLTFASDIPEGPTIGFESNNETPAQVVASIKSRLSGQEKILAERTETVNSIQWTTITQSSDFGIDNTTWLARSTKTLKVFYQDIRADTTGVFEDIVRSGRLSK